jgi:stage II sporulation protein GA (sporulation sigma-E factor processing peptidase)
MVVYAEFVFINNLIIDYLLLKASNCVIGLRTCFLRLLFCAFLGAVFATLLPLISRVKGLLFIKITVGVIMALLSSKSYRVRSYIYLVVCFFAITFFAVGSVLCVCSILGFKNYSIGIYVFSVIPICFVLLLTKRYSKYFYSQKKFNSCVFNCDISVGDLTLKTNGFLDTGNRVFIGQKPVVICNKNISEKLLSVAFKQGTYALKLTTLGGKSEIQTIKNATLKIYFNDKWHIYENVALGLSKHSFSYGLILHSEVLSGDLYV